MTKRYYYTDDDRKFLEKHYPNQNWDAIFHRFPDTTKEKIYSYCNKHGIKAAGKDKGKHGKNLNSSRWNDREDLILKRLYDNTPIEEILKMLPNRTYNAIICRASKLGLVSYSKKQQMYSKEEKQFVIDNWNMMSDYQLALALDRSSRSIKWLRSELGLLRQERDRDLTYENLYKYFRGNIYDWKVKSMEECDYKCVLTGTKDFAIHHLYNFTQIVNEFISEYNIIIKNFNEYTPEELENLAVQFNTYHNLYPLGVCISKDLHKEFHHIYGKYNNTPEQWATFVQNYRSLN